MKREPCGSHRWLIAPLAIIALMVGWFGEVPGVFAVGTNEITVVMKDKAFHVEKGGTFGGGFSMDAGMPTQLTLRNEDGVSHEFVSPMFMNVPVKLTGEATTITTSKASGFRVDPGKTVVLNFRPPVMPDFSSAYDVFWCNIHGKQHGEKMRGEIVIADTRCGTACE